MKLVTVAEMRAIETDADAKGLTYDQMMAHAGRSLADEILNLPFGESGRELLGLVGPGNNGGDTLVALAHLASQGWTTHAYLIKRPAEGDALVERLSSAGGEIVPAEKDRGQKKLAALLTAASIVLDGVLGTGFTLPLREDVGKYLDAAKKALDEMDWPPFIVAVDCPSGVDCDSGEAAAETIPAHVTVTMAAVKQGMLRFPAHDFTGEIRIAEIGLTDAIKPWKNVKTFVADEALVESILPARPNDAHKGTFGAALIAAGSTNYTGAAMLAGKAAYRVGAGLVQLAVPAPIHAALAGHFPEATWVLLPHEIGVIAEAAAEVLAKNFERATALLIGPGFGVEDTTKNFIAKLLIGKSMPKKTTAHIGFVHVESDRKNEGDLALPPLIVDADGLRLLAKIENWPELLPAPAVLTPHPGEMAALTGLSREEIQNDRLGVALKYAKEWGHVVVLKGAFTVIASPAGNGTVIPIATSALARAGTGDVLAGLIVGLRAQGVNAYEAAVAGAWIHANAGLYAQENVGSAASVIAGDVLDAVADVMSLFE
jgi:NAD(P)H-hydrate epimerase